MANITPDELRGYLTNAYSDEEITAFCSDYFRDVYNEFTAGMPKGQKIQRLLDYCQRREIVPNLLAALYRDRPEQFQKYFGRFLPEVSKGVATQLNQPSPRQKPPEKRPRSVLLRRRLIIVGAVLALLAIIVTMTLLRNPCIVSPRRISDKDGMTLLCVPPGDFLMGSAGTDPDATDVEKPQRKVELDAFWIDRTEVTNAMYAECVRQGACRIPQVTRSATHDNYYYDVSYRDYPVVYVLWEDARKYCEWAGRRLPTEAEWEKAARGSDGRIYPWGNEKPDAQCANYNGNIGDTTPVGSYPTCASPYGARDMAGNVWEWTADWYGETYYRNAPVKNPQGSKIGTHRVTRGGAYWSLYDHTYLRAAYRGYYAPGVTNDSIGFRCALSP